MVRLEDLIERDGNKCVWCSKELWIKDLNKEHILPLSRGGKTNLSNLTVACKKCNSKRKSKQAISFALEQDRQGLTPDWKRLLKRLDDLSYSTNKKEKEYATKCLKRLKNNNITEKLC